MIGVETFPFARAAEAYQISQDGHVRGKLVLVPGPRRPQHPDEHDEREDVRRRWRSTLGS